VGVRAGWAESAGRRGRRAGGVAGEAPLPSAPRAWQRLYDLPAPAVPEGCPALTSERLLRLAVAVGTKAALSPRQEIYPRGMPAVRALQLGLGALAGPAPRDAIKAAEIREWIASRFPPAASLPHPPPLDALLKEVRLDP